MAKTVLIARFRKGEVIGGTYTVQSKLGEGGAGTVYKCYQDDPDAPVAVKVLENAADIGRFKREAQVMRGTRSPHVVRVIRHGRHQGGTEFLVMEYLDGKSVSEYLARQGSLSAEMAAWIIIQAIRGLRSVRAVHRDLKPDNLLVDRNGNRSVRFVIGDTEEGSIVKVADFGLAKAPKEATLSLTNTGAVMGTPLYMSPEQCRNTKKVTVKTDIYALGVILYELTTGKPPFHANNIYDVMSKHCEAEPNLLKVPKKLRKIVGRCLEKKPTDRPQSLKALEDDLARAIDLEADGAAGTLWFRVAFIVVVVAVLTFCAWWFRVPLREWLEGLSARLRGPA